MEPWHGCRKISEGCRNCYVYRQDSRHDKDSREVRQTAMFDRPVRRSRDGRFKVPAGEMVYTCFTSDFLLEEADAWRAEAWEMMRIRHDLRFLFFTKRIDRLAAVLPPDWGDGYENVVIGCTVENQAMADYRLLLFLATPVRHRLIVCAPLLGPLDIARYLSPAVEEVSAGGESGNEARPCDYAWVLGLREQCVAADISFCFHQTGARFVKTGACTASTAVTSTRRPAKRESTIGSNAKKTCGRNPVRRTNSDASFALSGNSMKNLPKPDRVTVRCRKAL